MLPALAKARNPAEKVGNLEEDIQNRGRYYGEQMAGTTAPGTDCIRLALFSSGASNDFLGDNRNHKLPGCLLRICP